MAFSSSPPLLNLLLLTTLIVSAQQQTVLPSCDVELLQLALNFQFLEAEFFLYSSLGYGLDTVAPDLAKGGPSPIGVKKAYLDRLVRDIMVQFGYQEIGHLRTVMQAAGGGFPRPLIDLSSTQFSRVMDAAFGTTLQPPFDPYANSLNFLLASYIIPYVGLTGLVGSAQIFNSTTTHKIAAGLMAIESGQDAAIRTLLYQRSLQRVFPYRFTVGVATDRISRLRNSLGRAGVKDSGLLARKNRTGGHSMGEIVVWGPDSLAYARTPMELLRIFYGTGNESLPGGFFPVGVRGTIGQALLPGSDVNTTCLL
ncbi:hypothetical protein QJS04_geneDACA021501 [Acorus gramineus]|uniref:Desiccation-related protein PCC13-62 n=1 Tax=Acorus gramineus TaxID=55184 RepID=A0AAV9A4R1_ACOGR|nr:hypothetical protein QJS04_geneDACA021501 [Acorus gramineus]